MLRRKAGLVFLICLALAAISAAQRTASTQERYDVREHYTKYEYRIPMRDGVHLFTAVYVPKDTSQKYPFLMTRTPYSVGPYGEDQYPRMLGTPELERAGYIFVYQDVRGRYMSGGTFMEMRPHIDVKKTKDDVDDSSDTYDTIEWLLKHVPNNNGKVGIWGISYPGFYTSASIIDSHPAIKAASPEAPMTNLFMGDDAYHGGAFILAANFGFYTFFGPQNNPTLPPKTYHRFDYGTTDGYDFYLHVGDLANLDKKYLKGSNPLWNDQVNHWKYDDYWKGRDLTPHLKNIHCAVLTVGGWFDAEDLQGPFTVYHTIKKDDPGIFNGLVVGPWVHGGWAHYAGRSLGNVNFASNTGEFFRKDILFPFFEYYLKGKGDPKLPEAYVFETGTNRWRKYSEWPPKEAQKEAIYFHAGDALSFEKPETAGTSFDEYVSDPNHPVPFIDYTSNDVPQTYMDADQRFATKRPDVLVYETAPLDHDVTIVGPISPRLFVSTSGTDSDFIVKLIDVYPMDYPQPQAADQGPRTDVPPPQVVMGGYEQLVRGEPFRGKFRHSFENPEPFVPGKVSEVNFTMQDINHTFRKGHRIMVQVQSSWFPLIDRNPQTFVDIPNAKPSDFQKATERLYHSASDPSRIDVLVMPQE